MHRLGTGVDVPLGIEVRVEFLAGQPAIDQLHSANFNDSMPTLGFKPCGFGINDNLPHGVYALVKRSVRILVSRLTCRQWHHWLPCPPARFPGARCALLPSTTRSCVSHWLHPGLPRDPDS